MDNENEMSDIEEDNDALGDRIFDFLNGNTKEGKVVLTSQRRSDNRKSMKKINDRMKVVKRNNTLRRACQKKDKFTKIRKTRQNFSTLKPPVPRSHAKRIAELRAGNNPKLLDVYETNYNTWIMKREEALAEARANDQIEKEEKRLKQEKTKHRLLLRQHKILFQPVLMQLAPNTHTDTQDKDDDDDDKQSISSGPVNLIDTTIDQFFGAKGGRNQKRVERDFKDLYYTKIHQNNKLVKEWPDTIVKKIETLVTTQREENLKCLDCDVDLIIDRSTGECICTACGVSVKGGDGIAFKQTFQQLRSSSRVAPPYVRISHVSYYSCLFVSC